MLPTLWQQFGEGPFLFQHDKDPVHKERSIQKWCAEIGVKQLDWPAQSTDLNPIEHLWDELERRLRAGLINENQCPTSLMLVAEWKQVPAAMFQQLVESLRRRVEAVIAANADNFGMRCSMCPHTFGHIVYMLSVQRVVALRLTPMPSHRASHYCNKHMHPKSFDQDINWLRPSSLYLATS